ncbi:MAG: ATP-binding protein [Solirubrobacteraceae bacterium]
MDRIPLGTEYSVADDGRADCHELAVPVRGARLGLVGNVASGKTTTCRRYLLGAQAAGVETIVIVTRKPTDYQDLSGVHVTQDLDVPTPGDVLIVDDADFYPIAADHIETWTARYSSIVVAGFGKHAAGLRLAGFSLYEPQWRAENDAGTLARSLQAKTFRMGAATEAEVTPTARAWASRLWAA